MASHQNPPPPPLLGSANPLSLKNVEILPCFCGLFDGHLSFNKVLQRGAFINVFLAGGRGGTGKG